MYVHVASEKRKTEAEQLAATKAEQAAVALEADRAAREFALAAETAVRGYHGRRRKQRGPVE
jgi:hypothetical protein